MSYSGSIDCKPCGHYENLEAVTKEILEQHMDAEQVEIAHYLIGYHR